MEGEMEKLGKVWLTILASICYCYFIASKIPKGIPRLLSLLPVLYHFTILPLNFTSIVPTGITAFFITWLANFKLLLFAFNSGPVSPHPPKSFLCFLSLTCLPIKIKLQEKQKHHDQHPIPKWLHLNMPTKILFYAILVILHDYYQQKLLPDLLILLYCCMLYLFLDIVLGACIDLVRVVLGIELDMPSDEPYLSTSLQDFWGSRWNRMVSNTLRETIYKPVRSAFGKNNTWGALLGLLAAFAVSGLMHELFFYHVLRVRPTWEVTRFFVLHGVCVAVEFGVKKIVGEKWQLHWAVSALLTVGFVIVTAMWLIFPPLVRNGAVMKSIEENKAVIQALKRKLTLLR